MRPAGRVPSVAVRIRVDGPYLVTGVPLVRRQPSPGQCTGPPAGPTVEWLADGDEAYALCRCGSSPTRPFCDGTHRDLGFDGSPPSSRPVPPAACDGDSPDPQPAEAILATDGPLWVTGGVSIDHRQGPPVPTVDRMALCRCGASADKPYCDGSHARVGFRG
jgi:CDGSH-type Zn-finger protein